MTTEAQQAAVWWCLPNRVVMMERPIVFRVDAEQRLHCETGPAMAWPTVSRYTRWTGWSRYKTPLEAVSASYNVSPEVYQGLEVRT